MLPANTETVCMYGMNLIDPNQDESGQGERDTSHLISSAEEVALIFHLFFFSLEYIKK